jgi:hypothetical protein
LVEVQIPPPRTRATILLKSTDEARQVEFAKGAELETQLIPESVELNIALAVPMLPAADNLDPSPEDTTALKETGYEEKDSFQS